MVKRYFLDSLIIILRGVARLMARLAPARSAEAETRREGGGTNIEGQGNSS